MFGKIKEKYIKDGIAEYAKRLSKYTNLEIIEVMEENFIDNPKTEEIIIIMDKEKNNIENILALRGDYPVDRELEKGDFNYARELIEYIHKKKGNKFSIGAAYYVEGHRETNDILDLFYLKEKVNAGVDFLISQIFLDNEFFYSFRDKLEKLQINIPLVAGIMPVTNAKQIKKITSLCSCTIPKKFLKILEKYEDNPPALKEAGLAYAIEQVVDLVASDINGIHLYTMNKPETAKKIIDATSKDILMKSKAGALFNKIAGTRLGRYLSSALNFGSKIGGNVLMVAAAYTLGRWGDMISDFIQNYKTLSVTPLLKRGMPFIPAWAGNSGTIFMSPNWGKRGQVLDLMDSVFNHRFQDQEGYHPIAGSLSFLLNASMGGGPADALQRYELNADGNMYANNMGGDYEYLVNQNYVDGLLQRGSIRSVEQLLMRNNEENQKDKQEIKMRAEQFMHNIEDVQKDNTSILDPLVPVPGPEFDIFKQFKFFVVRHEKALNNEESKNTVEFSINQGGKPVKVIGIKGKDGDDSEIIDAPLLHPFALNTLRKIIFQAEQMLSYKTTTDQNTYINKVSNDYITLTSCYLFGTKKIFPGSGFGFTLIAHGESKENLKVIMDTLKEKDEITYQVYDNDDGKVYQVNVNIPKFGV